MDRLVRRASSVLGCPLDSVEVDTLTALGSSFSERLLHPRCVKERYRRSFLPAAAEHTNSNLEFGIIHFRSLPVACLLHLRILTHLRSSAARRQDTTPFDPLDAPGPEMERRYIEVERWLYQLIIFPLSGINFFLNIFYIHCLISNRQKLRQPLKLLLCFLIGCSPPLASI
ncbi:hypothetical protein D4764_01G0004790 [Takifugu flavidus]|uniref:Uncharacterized protein n=1 Tax=Takifugu flavidus TaxID=433684 RepID=A0A5C6PLR0_9TELE|nr:hypothetical protein D4764_01G0004790 [Takifugu flavidus]